jgi:hypothetical protein
MREGRLSSSAVLAALIAIRTTLARADLHVSDAAPAYERGVL